MTSSLLSKLFWTIALLCVFLIFFSGQVKPPNQSGSASSENKRQYTAIETSDKSSYPLFAQAYNQALALTDPTLKLAAINKALDLSGEEGSVEDSYLRNLHLMAAQIYENRWHVKFAIKSLLAAQALFYDQQVDRRLKRLTNHLARAEKERNLNQDYIATRFSGPAKVLKGKVLVAYIFIDDGIKTRWSDKSIARSNAVLNQVQKWQQKEARKYHSSEIQFINKTFIVQRNPQLKLLASISHKSSQASVEQLVSVIMSQLGADNVGAFIQAQMKSVGADQGVIFFHGNFERRSFARRCGYTHVRTRFINGKRSVEKISNCLDEYVMLMEKVQRNRWDKLHYVQAHESLHLFGADDLYNVEQASDYAVTDIMNYQSRQIQDSGISPITAFAIGWTDEQPDAPFSILEK